MTFLYICQFIPVLANNFDFFFVLANNFEFFPVLANKFQLFPLILQQKIIFMYNLYKLNIMEENKNKVEEQKLEEVAGGVHWAGKESLKEGAKEGGKSFI